MIEKKFKSEIYSSQSVTYCLPREKQNAKISHSEMRSIELEWGFWEDGGLEGAKPQTSTPFHTEIKNKEFPEERKPRLTIGQVRGTILLDSSRGMPRKKA